MNSDFFEFFLLFYDTKLILDEEKKLHGYRKYEKSIQHMHANSISYTRVYVLLSKLIF